MKRKPIIQKTFFKASAHEVFEMLMDSKLHAAFSEGSAKISRKVGGSFSVFDGYATGKNIKLVPDKKIVQSWHASDWKKDEISEVTFSIAPARTGCTLTFTQKNVPEEHYSAIKQGWIDFYWNPMKEMLKNR